MASDHYEAIRASGDRLVKRELSKLLGVSRVSVREALRQLGAEKIIVSIAHRCPTVALISSDEAMELYALQELLEGFAAREFALLAPDEAVAIFCKRASELNTHARSGRHPESNDRALRRIAR